MEEDKRIEERLLEKGITEYKIIRTITKHLQYREYYRKVSIEDLSEDRMLVIFKYKEGIAQFTVSSYQPINIIDSIIETSVENISNTSFKWEYDNFEDCKKEQNKTSYYFSNFQVKDYVRWIEDVISKVTKKTNMSFNTVYIVNVYKYCLRTKDGYLEQYNADSEFICIENNNFKSKAMLNNIFLNDNIVNSIFKEMNMSNIPTKKINLNNTQKVLMKAEGLAMLLNSYILMYYANYVYSNQSFIKSSYIGKQISKNKFNLISIPYDGIKFDSLGYKTFNKKILDSGKLVNLLSSSIYSRYMNITSFGNASLDDPNRISHQRLIFDAKNSEEITCESTKLIIYKIEQPYIDFEKAKFYGLAICREKSSYFRTQISFNLKDILDNIYPIGKSSYWINNVYCPDVIMLLGTKTY